MIDENKLKEQMFALVEQIGDERLHIDAVVHLIDDAPTVDAVPVRHGRWIVHHEKITFPTGEKSSGGMLCSECGYKTHNKMHVMFGCPFKHCPNCGADMRKDGDHAEGSV